MRRPTQKLNNAARMMRQQTFSIINYTSGDNWRKQQAAQARLGMSWSRPANVYESFNFKFTIVMIATMIAQFVEAHQ